jgi:dihydroorotate dehydrogenase
MYSRLRPWLFRVEPELVHAATLRTLQLVGALPPMRAAVRNYFTVSQSKPITLFGLQFPNRLGLAAGYDKDALAWRGLAALGFGHIEIGTVTPKPQPGNPQPRVFRLVEDQALINRLGFPSRGAAFVAKRLRGLRPKGLVLGVNLGINKDTPLERAAEDYLALMQVFSPLADYLVINISSPNTPGLRELQMRSYLETLLSALVQQKSKPLLVKLSPDVSDQQLEEAIGIIVDKKIDGVIATNTTISRPTLLSRFASETGGLSGGPLAERSRQVVARIYALTGGRLPIIAVGGIMSSADAQGALEAGASLVQIFTGLIYRGPGLVKEVLQTNSLKSK